MVLAFQHHKPGVRDRGSEALAELERNEPIADTAIMKKIA